MGNKHKKNNTVEVLCIGTELLLGNIINSNSRWLAEEISALGLNHYQQTVIGDNFSRLKQTILDIEKRSRFLITTGGLGPTPDDLTTETIASTFNTPLIEREEIWIDIKNKMQQAGKHPSSNNRKQALLPNKAIIIPNPSGTAPGMIWSPKNDFTILTFPGVPNELKLMWTQTAISWFKSNIENQFKYANKTLKFSDISESKLAEKINDLLSNKNPTIAPYANVGEVKLRITAKASDFSQAEALIKPIAKTIITRTENKCYGFDNDTLSSIVISLLNKKNQTLSVAESCTGGNLGAEITSIEGSSNVFLGGIIAYNNSIKQNLLDIPSSILEKYGAVSQPVVKLMAQSIRKHFSSDWSIAISGIAGPGGGSASKPVGLVEMAICGPNYIESEQKIFNAFNGRRNIQKLSVVWTLNRLRLILLSRS